MIPIPKAIPAPKIQRLDVKDWMSGTVTSLDDGRTPIKGLRSSGNVWLQQDGTIRPRPSLTRWGPQPTGTVLGEIFEYKVVSGLSTTNKLICMQNVSGVTNIYTALPEDTSWTKVTAGTTFDNSAKAHFCQLDSKVLIMNGVDTLAYYDIVTPGVTKFTALSNAAAPTVANNGSADLTTGTTSYTIWYAITANSSVGQTTGTATSKAINTQRALWINTTNSLKITWSAVTSAVSYNVYCGVTVDGDTTPVMGLLATGITSLSYVDDGTVALQTFNEMPTANSTAGPKASRGEAINGRLWLTGDASNPYYVWHGGDSGHELDFTPANGGGFVQIGSGGKELPIKAFNFRSGQGDTQIKVLTKGSSGKGKRFTITNTTLSVGDESFIVWVPSEDYGYSGTDSPDGLIIYNNSAYYPSRDGFKTTGTKPQLQNLLSTDTVSDTIQPDMANLNASAMSYCVGLGFEGRLYWALPVGSSANNQIWVLDLDRKGAWMKPWDIAADWMFLATDNTGTTHHCILKNNVLYQLAYVALTSDDGTAFSTSGNSGQIYFSEDGRSWGNLIQLAIVLLRPSGRITFTVTGRTKNSTLQTVGTQTYSPRNTQAGWSESGAGWSSRRGWSEIVLIPRAFNDATQEIKIKIRKDLQWFSYAWTTTDTGVDYNISKVVATFVDAGLKDL
jgi:hypothetical protein